jgi:hypothetical protein
MTEQAVKVRKSLEGIVAALFRDYEKQFPDVTIVNVRTYRQGLLDGSIGPVHEVVIHVSDKE